jgi:hypothetical protein
VKSVESAVCRGLASTSVRSIHDVVVDKGCGMKELEPRGNVNGVRLIGAARRRWCRAGEPDEGADGAEPFSAREESSGLLDENFCFVSHVRQRLLGIRNERRNSVVGGKHPFLGIQHFPTLPTARGVTLLV